jgi:hypothetical protein
VRELLLEFVELYAAGDMDAAAIVGETIDAVVDGAPSTMKQDLEILVERVQTAIDQPEEAQG